jgi:hypothetical protein
VAVAIPSVRCDERELGLVSVWWTAGTEISPTFLRES